MTRLPTDLEALHAVATGLRTLAERHPDLAEWARQAADVADRVVHLRSRRMRVVVPITDGHWYVIGVSPAGRWTGSSHHATEVGARGWARACRAWGRRRERGDE